LLSLLISSGYQSRKGERRYYGLGLGPGMENRGIEDG